jgi:uncharacterized protein
MEPRGMEVLSEDECRRLLHGAHVGRLGFTYRSLPVVLPLNILVQDDEIIFRTEAVSILSAAIAGDVACIEVDNHELLDHVGWSVLATGRLREIEDPDRLAEVERLPVPTWRPMGRPHYLSLGVEMLAGRRVGLAPPVAAR